MLGYVIHIRFEGLDVGVIPSDGHAVFDNVLSHVSLFVSQLIHHETKVGVDLIVPAERLIHVVRVHLQLHNLLLTGSNSAL